MSFEESSDSNKWLASSGNGDFPIISQLFARSKHLTRISRMHDASIHRDPFSGTGRRRGHLLAAAWSFQGPSTVVWRPIAADGSAGPYVGKLRAAIVNSISSFPLLCRDQVWSTFEEVGKRHAAQANSLGHSGPILRVLLVLRVLRHGVSVASPEV